MSKRKAYKPRAVLIPALIDMHMTSAAHPDLALTLRLSIVSLIEHPTVAACNHLSLQLTRIAGGMSHANKGKPILHRTDADSIAIKSAIMAVESIVTRHDRNGIVMVDEYQAMALQAAASKLDDVLGKIPASMYQRASNEIKQFLGE